MLDQQDLQAIAQLIAANNETLKIELREEMRASNESLKTELREEMRTSNETLKTELREEMRTYNEDLKEEIMLGVNSIIETKVTPSIQLIAEQHGEIIRRLKGVSEIDDLKSRICTLERVILSHTTQLEMLKKAQ